METNYTIGGGLLLIALALLLVGISPNIGILDTEINQNITVQQMSEETLFLNHSGWADYIDTEFNSSNRFTATNTTTHFPNNAGEVRDSQIPKYINESGGFYNGTHILGRNGDGYGIAIRGKAEPTTANSFCQFLINIGGSVGELPIRLMNFPRGQNEVHDFEFYAFEYTLDTWEANGGNISVSCINDVEFWNTSMKIVLIHKAR